LTFPAAREYTESTLPEPFFDAAEPARWAALLAVHRRIQAAKTPARAGGAAIKSHLEIPAMNFLGKVFIVLVLIISVVVMSIAVVVYTTHKNWRDLVENPQTGLRKQLTDARANFQALQSQYNQRVQDLSATYEVAEQQIRKLENEREVLQRGNSELQAAVNQLNQSQRDLAAAVNATNENNKVLSDQVTQVSAQNRANEDARDRQFKAMLTATEEVNQRAGEFESALERNQDMARLIADMTAVMQANGIDPQTDPNAVMPIIDGVVSSIARRDGNQFVEVTIGADDGLKPGHTLEVFRGSKYLGRLDVLRTSPDKAVGQVIRSFQQGAIQEGDRVATRLTF
jgi:hypothetical protein